jgi:CRP/FNR family cyclic AMP-dependent transcriptional regulator
MTKMSTNVRLLEVEPDFGRFLTDEERLAADELVVPVQEVRKGRLDLTALLRDEGGFGAMVLEGMVMHRIRIADQATVRLLGPGDFLAVAGLTRSMLVGESDCSATGPVRLGILGDEVLAAAQRWPQLGAGIYVRVFEQMDRLAAQLAICQLPRVDQRLLSLLWLLAESWGRVGPAGTVLPVSLTHDALGSLIGARRPTVTLALGELSERGAIVRQERGWLLLEQPLEMSSEIALRSDEPELFADQDSGWLSGPTDASTRESRDELRKVLQALREEHRHARERLRNQLAEMRRSREDSTSVRRRIAGGRITRRAPSSG